MDKYKLMERVTQSNLDKTEIEYIRNALDKLSKYEFYIGDKRLQHTIRKTMNSLYGVGSDK